MRPNWTEIEASERDERAAILAADGIDPALAVEMTRANIEARKKAHGKREFMERMKREHVRSSEREARFE